MGGNLFSYLCPLNSSLRETHTNHKACKRLTVSSHFKVTKQQSIRQDFGRILVVDSDAVICEMIQTHFGPEGFIVDSCTNVNDLYSLELAEYRLIIIDLNIDSDHGISIVEQIKQRRDTASIGVITCSVNMSPTTIINALNAGADDYLIKPFSLRELMARVRSVLRRRIP